MNQSIYLMVSVPYLTLGVLGFFVYRGCRKNAAFRQSLQQANAMTSPMTVQSGQGAT